MNNRNPSATKKGPGRYHKQGYRHTQKSNNKSVLGQNPLLTKLVKSDNSKINSEA